MNLATKFDLHQHVWYVWIKREEHEVKCPACEGMGYIWLNVEHGEKQTFSCPKCYGRKKETVYGKEIYSVFGHSIIGKITYELQENEFKPFELLPDVKISYMLYETGIGSGSLWPEENIFATEAEAQAFCEFKNTKEHKDEL